MKYLILLYSNSHTRQWWESLTPKQQSGMAHVHTALTNKLAESGELVVSEALAELDLTKRVTVTDGKMLVTDGPLAEAKEQIAGFFLVDCESMDKALEHAAGLPEAQHGLIEVRPILDLNGLEM